MALGKGLKTMISSEPTGEITKDYIQTLKITEVEPNANQPRKFFDDEKLKALSESISEMGVIIPIIVVKNPTGGYTIIAGERRWRASKLAGKTTIPAIVKNFKSKEATEVALIENLQREDLNPIEEAEGYKSLIDGFSMTQEEISARVGKSRSTITNSLRLLNLPGKAVKYLIDGSLTQGHARALLSLEKDEDINEFCDIIIKNSLNVRQVEKLVKEFKENPKSKKTDKKKNIISPEIKSIEKNIEKLLKTKVNIKSGNKKGIIEISYYGNDDLERILNYLKKIDTQN